ncbi:MAG: Mov34/MPN/PAD-1 family protein, partial [Halobacteriales archaeon]|nr:Mov34/MPN/PAD-1 family protein [Halobacteriales archaeon]
VYNRETTGLHVGAERVRTIRGKRRRVVALEAATPFQTAARNVTWVEPANHRALFRARAAPSSLGFRVVGEYHSHTNNENGLSQADVDYARENLRRMNGTAPKRWLELVLGMRRREFAKARTPGWTWRDYPRKASCSVVLTPHLGFDITIAGYWIGPNGSPDTMVCDEATVYIPWSKRYWT